MKRRSNEITGNKEAGNWEERTPARTMLRAVGFQLVMIPFGNRFISYVGRGRVGFGRGRRG